MRHFLPSLALIMVISLFGCASDCTQKLHVGGPNSTGVYTDSDGIQHQVTADSNGDVTVPCNISSDRINMLE